MTFDETQRRAALAALWAQLQAEPRLHDFFATLRRVEALHPEWPRLGQALRPSQEALRLCQEPELDFAPAALHGFDRDAQPAPRLSVRLFGLLGPQGPMPLFLTEYARERKRAHGDPTLARFLDIFHHRLLALYYRAWAQNQPTVQHDRPTEDRFAAWLGASFGFDRRGHGTGHLPAEALLFQAGLLGMRSRHPEGLGKLLSQYFGVPVRIEQHVAQWLQVEDEDRTLLGFARNRAERARGEMGQLGVSATGGKRLLDRQFKFRIVIGPLTLAAYHGFLPGGRTWLAMREWVRQYQGLDLRWDVQLILAREHVPKSHPDHRVRLGVTTWIGRSRAPRDRGDLRLRPDTSFLQRHGIRCE